jgi:hypothetical protein
VESGVIEVTNAVVSNMLGNFEGWEGSTILELTNGQVWQQSDFYIYYGFYVQPRIVIYSEPACLYGSKAVLPEAPAQGVCVRRL